MKYSATIEHQDLKTQKFVKDLNTLGNKQRNGLFSEPISLAVGDIYYVPATRKRDERGNVPNKPKNFFTSKMKKGSTDSALFSKPTYNGISDPYEEPFKNLQLRSTKSTRSKPRPFTAGGNPKQRDVKSFLK